MLQTININTSINDTGRSSNPGDFTFIFERNDINKPILERKMPLMQHGIFTLIWVIEGKGSHFIDSTEYPLQGGHVFLIAPGQDHQWQEDARFTGISCLFSQEVFDEFHHTQVIQMAGLFNKEADKKQLTVPENKEVLLKQLAQILYSEAHKDKHDLYIIHPVFMTFLYTLTSHENKKNIQSEKSGQLNKLKILINEFYHKENSVQFYAQQLNISIKQLNTLVKEKQGKTVSNLIQERVLLEAKRNLILSHDSVKTIAYQLGFEDPSYFSRFFRRYTGNSPNQYREKLKQKNERAAQSG